VKEAPEGRECDTRSESEILKASSLLASLHLNMQGVMELTKEDQEHLLASDALEEMRRHNRELRKIDRFIRKKNRKNDFETAYLSCFRRVMDEALEAEQRLTVSGYEKLRQQAISEGRFCHGEYVHHNILVSGGRMTVINFERIALDVQVNDLYLFLRKIMEKQNYDLRLGMGILRAYACVRPLSETELNYLSIRLAYPEKFWKLANHYYNTNKAWIPGKHMEKLEKFLVQREKRVSFSKEILYNISNYNKDSGR
jgi:CotS family spore coat protein